MLSEHEAGRKYMGEIAGAFPKAREGDAAAITSMKNSLASYVRLLRAHIMKENGVLFPMSDRILTSEDQSELEKAFNRVEAEEIGEGIHEKYHSIAHELEKKFGEMKTGRVQNG